jgi:hypothetical protein
MYVGDFPTSCCRGPAIPYQVMHLQHILKGYRASIHRLWMDAPHDPTRWFSRRQAG